MAKKKADTLTAPEIPSHAFTVNQWAGNPELQRQLQAVLESPILQMAFQTLLLAAMPNAAPITQLQPGISAEAMALADSNRYHHRSGMTHTYRALHSLARAKNTAKRSAEWGELLDDDE